MPSNVYKVKVGKGAGLTWDTQHVQARTMEEAIKKVLTIMHRTYPDEPDLMAVEAALLGELK